MIAEIFLSGGEHASWLHLVCLPIKTPIDHPSEDRRGLGPELRFEILVRSFGLALEGHDEEATACGVVEVLSTGL